MNNSPVLRTATDGWRQAAASATARPLVARRYAVPGAASCANRAMPVLHAGHRLAVQDLGTYQKGGALWGRDLISCGAGPPRFAGRGGGGSSQ